MILLDTNILARVIQQGDPQHQSAIDAISALRRNASEVLIVVPQVLIEFYSISTRPGKGLGLTVEQTIVEINHIKREYPVLPESSAVFSTWEQLIQKYKLINRQVYDLRLVASMLVHQVRTILTFNDADFLSIKEIQTLHPLDVLGIPRV